MSKKILMEKLMEYDFMAIDLAMFLDTHPHDKKAIGMYNSIAAEGERVRKEYEEKYGPILHHCAAKEGKWEWICEPWPWECEANIDISGGE